MQPQPSFQLPAQMSTGAAGIDQLYYFIFWFSVVFTVAITGVMIYFIVKYKRRAGDKPEAPLDLTKLEIFWTVVPVFFIVVLFHIGFKVYIQNALASEGALEIRVRGKKWSWEFEYPNGSREPGELRIPVNRPVKLILSSDDVIHSFYVPGARWKKDAVPGMYSTVAFTPNAIGDLQVFCAEYCGTSHSGMLATIKVVSEDDYKKYLEQVDRAPAIPPQQWGEQLFTKNGCTACHSRDGSPSPGPTFKGLFHRKESITGGPQIDVDENYIRESILHPQAKIVQGYTNVQMPTFVLKDNQIDALIAYIKTLK